MPRRLQQTTSRRLPTCCYHGVVDKVLLLSILVATFAVPIAGAGRRNPRKALQTMLTGMIAAELAYAFFVRFLHGRLG